jgi:hypothetical protein
MLQTKQLQRVLMTAVIALVPGLAVAQTAAQATAEGYALYDRIGRAVAAKAGVAAPEAAESAQLGCQRYAQSSEIVIRFALAASLAPGTSLDSPRAETRRQAADLMVDDAQTTLGQLAAAGATIDQCAAAARSFGAQSFSLARTINRGNVERNAQTFMAAAGIVTKPAAPAGRSEEEIAAEEAAKAEIERVVAEAAEAQRKAQDILEHAFASLPPARPVVSGSRALPLTFNIYLVDTPAAHEVKDFRVCFEPGLYQRAAKPVVDLASAGLEVPEALPVIDQAAGDFLARVRPVLAQRFGFPADRLVLEYGEAGAVRGPTADPVKAAAAGCNIYLAPRAPLVAHNDGTTSYGLLAENVTESTVMLPALRARNAVLPKLETLVMSDPPATSDAADPANPLPTQREAAQRCAQDARCRIAVRVAVNGCMQTAERRIGRAAIVRETEARQQLAARPRSVAVEDDLERDEKLILANLEVINEQMQASLERLAQQGNQLRDQARRVLSTLDLDAVTSAGRTQGEGSMGAPALQCYSRLAGGQAAGIILLD